MDIKNNERKIILSFDLEFWYDSALLNKYIDEKTREAYPDLVLRSTRPIMDTLKERNVHATFFVTGKLAEKYPDLIKEISERHEVACHSYSHKTLYGMREDDLKEDIERNKRILERITGKDIGGYRAPAFSLNDSTKHLIAILEDLGFRYDSSLVPANVGVYGYGITNKKPHFVTSHNLDATCGKIMEFPLNVFNAIIKIPISGGFYFRVIPYFIYKWIVGYTLKKDGYFVFYAHPHEFIDFVPDLKAPRWKMILKYWNVDRAKRKLDKFLSDFEFTNFESIENES